VPISISSFGKSVTVSPLVGPPQSCKTPCQLTVPIGPLGVDVREGDLGYRNTVNIAGPSTIDVELKSGPGVAIAFTVIGGIGFLVGLTMFGANGFSTQQADCTSDDCTSPVGAGGAAAMGIGGAFLLGGLIGFAVRGRDRIDVQPNGVSVAGGRLLVGGATVPGGGKGMLTLAL
jgi:hypothetical protein